MCSPHIHFCIYITISFLLVFCLCIYSLSFIILIRLLLFFVYSLFSFDLRVFYTFIGSLYAFTHKSVLKHLFMGFCI